MAIRFCKGNSSNELCQRFVANSQWCTSNGFSYVFLLPPSTNLIRAEPPYRGQHHRRPERNLSIHAQYFRPEPERVSLPLRTTINWSRRLWAERPADTLHIDSWCSHNLCSWCHSCWLSNRNVRRSQIHSFNKWLRFDRCSHGHDQSCLRNFPGG
jgi:hypothetical protein